MFDPDYRTKQWNKSRFAPKNSRNTKKGRKHTPITDIAAGLGGITFIGVYLLLSQIDILPSAWYWDFGSAAIAGVVVFMFTGMYITTKEANRFRQAKEESKTNTKAAPKQTSARKNPKKKFWQKRNKTQDTAAPKKQRPIKPDIGEPIIGSHSTMSAREFEEQIAWLINATTRYRAEVVGGAGDGGVDVKIFSDNRQLVGIIQCKRYNPDKPLAPTHIRALAGVKARMKVNVAYLATTAYFTHDAEEEAEQLGIKLLDGDKINRMVYKISKQLRTS